MFSLMPRRRVKGAGNVPVPREYTPFDLLRRELAPLFNRASAYWPTLFEPPWELTETWGLTVEEKEKEIVVRAEVARAAEHLLRVFTERQQFVHRRLFLFGDVAIAGVEGHAFIVSAGVGVGGDPDLPQVVQALHILSGVSSTIDCRQQQARQNGNHGDDYEQFDQRKGGAFHASVFT